MAHIEQAKERLILERATHLDSLVARLAEPRVRRVLEPVLAGAMAQLDPYDDDLQYARDLGLVASTRPVQVANPIYHEVLVRVMAGNVEENVLADPRSFVLQDGRLDFDRLLREFAAFWVEHGEVLANGIVYHEVAPQLVLMGFLQRVVNGEVAARNCGARKLTPRARTGGFIQREYGVGRGRIDLLVRWPYQDPAGKQAWQREAVELKVWRKDQPDPLPKSLSQLDAYLDGLGLDRGTLVLFDRRSGDTALAELTRFEEATTPSGRQVTLLHA